jgi:hypothetical protein
MSDSQTMTVLYVKSTGNVLAALTQVAQATGAVTAADLAGPALIVRNLWNFRPAAVPPQVFSDTYPIPPDALDVADVPLDPDVLFMPRMFMYDTTQKALKPLPNQVGQIEVQVATVDFKATQLKVSATDNVPDDTPVWILVNGTSLSSPWTGTGTIPKNSKNLTLNHDAFASGSYSVLLLAKGYLPDSLPRTIT